MAWIDTHCHLANDEFATNLDDVLFRAKQAGVSEMICVAVDHESCLSCIKIAEKFPNVWASVGIHPNYAHQEKPEDWNAIRLLAENSRVCALGETGLDLHWDDCPFDIQQANFAKHWELSRETQLPVIIHMRDCEAEMLDALDRQSSHGQLCGVMHSFAGSASTAAKCVELGLYISFAGMLTYKKSQALREVARNIPLDRILVETDSPYLSPEPVRSKRPNEPAHVMHTAKCLAETLGISVGELAKLTYSNTKRLFSRIDS